MTTTNFRIEVELTDPVNGYDGPLSEYPDIPDSDKASLEWNVTGRFKMISSGESLTVSWDKTPGWLDDYVWKRIMFFHWQFESALDGEESELSVLDNPGTIRFTPEDGVIRVTFIYPEDGERKERAASVPTRAVGEAVLAASEDLREELLDVNQQLGETRLVTDLDERIEQTRALLD